VSSRALRTAIEYLGAIVAGGALALLANYYSARDNVYVMLSVLLVVAAALVGGTGPAMLVAITVVIGDDLVLSGRLPPLEQWRDEVVFGTIAITVGLLVAAKRKQQLKAEQLAARERTLRTERDTILAAISHDVRNPLAVIIGSARQAAARGVANDVQRVLKRIDSAAIQASQLIDLLTDLRSLEGDAMQLDLQRHDLRRTIEMAIEQMEGVVRNHRLRCGTPASPVEAVYDEGRMQRVFQNLIGNAIKYSPEGGDVEVRLETAVDLARITVRDHGIGIPEAERELIFERGYRAQGTNGIPGSGLGLFISAEIVKRHRGRIACEPAPGGGTIFEVRLPLIGVGASAERVEQLRRGGPRPPAADGPLVDGDDRDELPRRAGEKRLVRAE
jgi:signal transduction histidine kinase